MTIENLPIKYQALWDACLPFLKQGRPGDDEHAKEVVQYVLQYQPKLKFDPDVLVPVAMLHDIGHSAILPEHFKYVTGQQKLVNGKLAHMLAGAKIAHDLLLQVGYDVEKSKEIVDIISMHDADQLKIDDWRNWYDTDQKKIFHDIDALDRYNETRIKHFIESGLYDRNKMIPELQRLADNFFYPELKQTAEENLKKLN
ncbi:MAG: HD domain-containing protein [Patescibacteria group bacterium]